MMPLLTTKLRVPCAYPNAVARLQLIQRLDAGLWRTPGEDFTRRLTLVAAPAGYGKTTLLCEWINHLAVPCAWVTFDEADSDPGAFLRYLIAAARTVAPDLARTVPDASASPQFVITPSGLTHVMATVLNDLASVSRPFILVFDDYHTISSSAVHQAVTFLLDHMPNRLSLVIATRADPPLPLARLRARTQLVEVRAEQLRFSGQEAATFLRQTMHLDVQDQDVSLLADRTEGWIAGLQMAALALQNRSNVAGFIQAFSGYDRFVMDYLFEEVLRLQPDPIQTFLIQTSILDRMTGPLCDAVRHGPDGVDAHISDMPLACTSGQEILEFLERANLFVVSLDRERRYYRYHHLFADLLHHRLGQAFPDLIPILHQRAAQWHEQQGSIGDALDHLIAAGDVANASRLVQEFGWQFLTQGRVQQVLAWLRKVPEQSINAHPWLSIIYSWALIFAGQTAKAESYASSLQHVLSASTATDDPDVAKQRGYVAGIHAYLAAVREDVVGITHYAHLALQHLPAEDVSMRSILECCQRLKTEPFPAVEK